MKNIEREALLWASLNGFANKDLIAFYSQIEEFTNFFSSRDASYLRHPMWTNKQIENLKKCCNTSIEQKYETLHTMQIHPIIIEDDFYPESLALSANPPIVLYTIGKLDLLEKNSIGIVGARKHTAYGKRICHNLVKSLMDYDVAIISGMALGIDSIAHRVCLENDGATIAVLGNGIDSYYPKSNGHLWEEVCQRGLVLSEYPPGKPPYPSHFPERNRIIAYLSSSLIVVEAKEKSGSLITARLGAESGKNVYAVPGNIDSLYSQGTNKLIYDGAFPLVSIETFIKDNPLLPLREKENISQLMDNLGEDEKIVLKAILDGIGNLDLLSIHLPLDTSTILSCLTILELKGYITGVDSEQIVALNI